MYLFFYLFYNSKVKINKSQHLDKTQKAGCFVATGHNAMFLYNNYIALVTFPDFKQEVHT